MNHTQLDIVFLGLSITSSWGNGHATTYRGLVRELAKRGHRVTFLERDLPWYSANRDMPSPPFGRTCIYSSIEDLKDRFVNMIKKADLVIVGSYVPDGIEIGSWINAVCEGKTAFYDIDTPVTIARVTEGDCNYLDASLIPQYDLYLSFTGGPILEKLQEIHGSPMARALYCSVDPDQYYPEAVEHHYDMGYLGTYSADRQPPLQQLMLKAALLWKEGRFVVAGPQYPDSVIWPDNVERIFHLSPDKHRRFYNSQRFTLNITRIDMIKAGYSPSVRLFEAAACGVPIISDYWKGLNEYFELDKEILVSQSPGDTLFYLKKLPEEERQRIGERARVRVLSKHTSAHRAAELETYALSLFERTKAR
ncbi:MAG: glycosyltransferase [Syntrophothermus sp.]